MIANNKGDGDGDLAKNTLSPTSGDFTRLEVQGETKKEVLLSCFIE